MLDSSTLFVFVAAAFTLIIIPGPAVLYIIARSIDQGRTAGVVSVLGLEIGTLFHVTAAALGLSALLVSSALAFNVVKYLGAAYLIYLGVQKLRSKETPGHLNSLGTTELSHVFRQGIIVNILNPKTALFFFAFLPQFVDPTRGSATIQILMLGLIFVAIATCSDGLYALLAGTAGHWLKGNLRFWRAQRYFAGGVYIALGVGTALAGSDSK
jgi:threonine/homoserine/homoserine lactone efflux protein